MNREIARALLLQELKSLRDRSYESLAGMIGQTTSKQLVGPDGKMYQLEVEVFWDDRPMGNVRVMVSIDDAGWRAFAPVSDSFIIAPTGGFVGE